MFNVVVNIFNLSTQEKEAADLCEFEGSLIDLHSELQVTTWDPVSKSKQTHNNSNKKKHTNYDIICMSNEYI